MVSQGAQTNGDKNNARRLMKSYSEVGGQFGAAAAAAAGNAVNADSHEPLQRTQSEEPPRYLNVLVLIIVVNQGCPSATKGMAFSPITSH